MNKRSFFNLTAVIVLLFTVLISCLDVFAQRPKVRAYDDNDMEIFFNENNYALNAGNVTFVLDTDALLPGQMYVYEDGGPVTAVNDGTYVMEAGEDGEIRFVNFYIKKGDEMKDISDSPYFVEFADAINIAPDVVYEDRGEGKAPGLTVGTRPWVQTYLCIDNGSGETKKHVTGKTDISFSDDGEYKVSVYTVDGRGNRTYSKKIPEKIVVDKKPPIITDLDTDIESNDEEGSIFGSAVTLSAKAWDERSKIDSVCWEAGGETVKADNIVLNPPFKGSISVYAKDSAGNTSEKIGFFKEIIVDDEVPVISVSQKEGEKNGVLKIGISASDRLSGMDRIETVLDGKVLSRRAGSKDEISLDLSGSGYEEKRLQIRAFDRAGNRAENIFVVRKTDNMAPDIRIYGVSDRGVYGNDVDVAVDAHDDSGSLGDFSVNVLVKDASGKMIYSRTTDSGRLRITQPGTVTVAVSASDPSGNTGSSTVTFILDKEAPVISGLEKYDGKIFESFLPEEEPQDMIEDQSCVTYDVYLNGLEYDGREVVQDGNYVLKMTAVDEFGRRTEEKAVFTVRKKAAEEEAEENVPEEERPLVPVSENTVREKMKVSAYNTPEPVSVNMLSGNKVSENKLSGNKIPADKNSLSANAASGADPVRGGFLERLRYGILKLFGLKPHRDKS